MTNETDLNQIKQRIRTFIAQNLLYSENVFSYSDDDSFLEQGIIDSLGVMQLVEFVQANLNIAVTQEEIAPENFDSVNKLAALVSRKLDKIDQPGNSQR